MNDKNKRGVHTESRQMMWSSADCGLRTANLETEPLSTQDQSNWRKMMTQISDLNGHWDHD